MCVSSSKPSANPTMWCVVRKWPLPSLSTNTTMQAMPLRVTTSVDSASVMWICIHQLLNRPNAVTAAVANQSGAARNMQ